MQRRHLIGAIAPTIAGAAISVRAETSRARLATPHVETVDGVRLFVTEWGAGHPVVFVHGAYMSSAMWEYQMEAIAAAGMRAVAYDRLKMRVDRGTLTPIEIEAYAASGLLIKTLRFKDMKDFGSGLRRPATMETDSPLHKDHKSVMLYGSIKARGLSDEIFTLEYLPRAGELR